MCAMRTNQDRNPFCARLRHLLTPLLLGLCVLVALYIIPPFYPSKSSANVTELYRDLGFRCDPLHCNHEEVISNVTRLLTDELQIVLELVGPMKDLETPSTTLERNSVPSLFLKKSNLR